MSDHSIHQFLVSGETKTTKRDNLLNNPVLLSKLPNLHREGSTLAAGCPKCGENHTRNFFAGPKFDYSLWHCRDCNYTVRTAELLGLAWESAPRPAVQPWQEDETDPERLRRIRDVYGSLTTFAQDQLVINKAAQRYLTGRGVDLPFAIRAGLGYIDGQSYRQWYQTLPQSKRTAAKWAGLPDGDRTRLSGHAAMFAGGYQGKIVFPYFDEDGTVADLRTRSISSSDTMGGRPVRYTSPKGGQADRGAAVPYGLDMLGESRRVVLTEGEFKRLSVMAAGSTFPVLSLRGVDDLIKDFQDYLRGRLVVLAFDNDKAGQLATVKVGRKLAVNQIDVVVQDPDNLIDEKGIDDFVLAHGIDAFDQLVVPDQTVTLPEYEAKLTRNGIDLASLKQPKTDQGTVRRWTPEDHVDEVRHEDIETITVDEAVDQIEQATRTHWETWRRGRPQVLITAGAGVGKTFTTMDTAKKHANETGGTIALFLPSHAQIDEKIGDGTLSDFKHIYGRRWDDEVENCEQAETAQLLTKKGYSPGAILCPLCPYRAKCEAYGYKSQFKGKENRAYVHAHLHSDYPEGEDLAVVDELSHKTFIETTDIWSGDLMSASQNAGLKDAQRELLDGLVKLYGAPDLADMDGVVLYETLERFYPNLRNVDAWGDGLAVQMALDEMAKGFAQRSPDDRNLYEAEELPDQFGKKLFSVLAEDVRRIVSGQAPTGRIRLVALPSGHRFLSLTTSKGPLPAWYTKRPTVVLNATGDAQALDSLIGPLDVVSPQVAVLEGNEVIQDVTFNNAKSGLLGDSPEAERRRDAWRKRIQVHIDAHDDGEADTTIVTTKALVNHVTEFWPAAKIAYYGHLEGRNDLQSGLTILANSPPVNLAAVQREAAALWPGIDTTLTRRSVAFGETNAGGEHLAVEQIDAVDERVRSLLWQHRDAVVVQAVQRARLVRQSGRKVVALFARPIPGLRPTQTIKDRPSPAMKAAETRNQTLDRMISSARKLIEEDGAFTLAILAAGAEVSRKTAYTRWQEVTTDLGLKWFDVPVLQPLANGGTKRVDLRVAVSADIGADLADIDKMHDVSARYNILLIALGNVVHPLLPDGWVLNLPAPMDPAVDVSEPRFYPELFAQRELAHIFRPPIRVWPPPPELYAQGEAL